MRVPLASPHTWELPMESFEAVAKRFECYDDKALFEVKLGSWL